MATKNVIFDPDSGVPFGLNLTMYGGADFVSNLNIKTTSNSNFNLTGYTASAAMSKSVSIGATLGITSSFTVGFTSAYNGEMRISLGSTSTRNLSEGRYLYDILVSSGTTVYNLVRGNIYVYPSVSSEP